MALLDAVCPFVEVCDEIFEGVGGDILEGVAGCRGRTIPPPGGKMLDAGGGGRERSIKDSVMKKKLRKKMQKIVKTLLVILREGVAG